MTTIKFKTHFLAPSKSTIHHPSTAPYPIRRGGGWGSKVHSRLGQDLIRDCLYFEQFIVMDLKSVIVVEVGVGLTGTKFVSTGPAMNASWPATAFRNSIFVLGPITWYPPKACWRRDKASARSLP